MIRKPHKRKHSPSHPWNVAGEKVKRERMRKIATAIAALRAPRSPPC